MSNPKDKPEQPKEQPKVEPKRDPIIPPVPDELLKNPWQTSPNHPQDPDRVMPWQNI